MRTISNAALRDARALRETLVEMGRLGSLRDPMFGTCEALDLTPPQFHALLWLGHDGALPMGELARLLGTSEKTMTGVVDRLEKAKLVRRVRDSGDRRVIRVRLTAAGLSTYGRLDQDIERKISWLLALLDAGDRTALLRVFRKLNERLRQAPSTDKVAAP